MNDSIIQSEFFFLFKASSMLNVIRKLFRLTLDLTQRHSVLSILVGGVPFYVYTCSMSQSMVQRYVALPTLKDANRALIIFMILIPIFILICSYNGLLVYAWYVGCDPLQTKVCFEYNFHVPNSSKHFLLVDQRTRSTSSIVDDGDTWRLSRNAWLVYCRNI